MCGMWSTMDSGDGVGKLPSMNLDERVSRDCGTVTRSEESTMGRSKEDLAEEEEEGRRYLKVYRPDGQGLDAEAHCWSPMTACISFIRRCLISFPR